MNDEDMTPIEALIALHEGTDRQGPGDEAMSLDILRRLPNGAIPSSIADLGCGTGTSSLMLARHFGKRILCVDMSEKFLRTLSSRAEEQGLGDLIKTLCADMGALDPEKFQFDLIWSEGAAYNLTFEGAMQKWRPLLKAGGVAVVSELSWFVAQPHPEALSYWSEAYPEIGTEAFNEERAERHGFEVLFTERLPTKAWWTSYYNPLLERLEAHASSTSRAMQDAIAEMRQEIELFRKHSDDFGYTFYALKAV